VVLADRWQTLGRLLADSIRRLAFAMNKEPEGVSASRVRWAADTEVIRRLESEWCEIAESPRLCERLREWAEEDPRLAFENGTDLVRAAQSREVSRWSERDRVLTALLERFDGDPLARRLALQIVLPQVKSLINQIRGWDTEERAARVVATAVEVLAHCAAEPAGATPNFRVFANTRRRILRAAIRDRNEPLVLSADFAEVEDSTPPERGGREENQHLAELIDWVREKGQLREETARLVVLSRAGGVSVSELAEARRVSAQTMRRQRLRAEQRLRRGLSLVL
jgi:hypothetical protein